MGVVFTPLFKFYQVVWAWCASMLSSEGQLSQGTLCSCGTVPLLAFEVYDSFNFGVFSVAKVVAPVPACSFVLPFSFLVIHLKNVVSLSVFILFNVRAAQHRGSPPLHRQVSYVLTWASVPKVCKQGRPGPPGFKNL